MIIGDSTIIEDLLWGLIPSAVAIGICAWSIVMAFKARGIAHIAISAFLSLALIWSLIVLYRIFILNTWPTFLPHIVIAAGAVIAVVQWLFYRKRQRPAPLSTSFKDQHEG